MKTNQPCSRYFMTRLLELHEFSNVGGAEKTKALIRNVEILCRQRHSTEKPRKFQWAVLIPMNSRARSTIDRIIKSCDRAGPGIKIYELTPAGMMMRGRDGLAPPLPHR